jgi:ABC-2 type transport system permease protein
MVNMLKVWLKFVQLNVRTWMEYRIDFYVGFISMAFSNIIPIMFFWVMFSFTTQLNGWMFPQVMFMLGMNYLVIGIWHTFLTGISPWGIERRVRNGEFDRVLLQPIGDFWYLALSRIDNDGPGDLIAGILVLFYGASLLSIAWNLQMIALLASFIAGGVLIFFAVNVAVSSVSLIAVRSSALGDILWNLERFIEYPLDIFNPFVIFLMTFVIPFGFINYYPAQVFLGKGIWMQAAYLSPLVGVISLAVAYLIWTGGLKHYSSTGS